MADPVDGACSCRSGPSPGSGHSVEVGSDVSTAATFVDVPSPAGHIESTFIPDSSTGECTAWG